MLDFLMVSAKSTKRGTIEIYPKFVIKKSSDLMIRGGDFYAIWDDEQKLWSTDEQDALQLIDQELIKYKEENKKKFDSDVKVCYMWDAENGMIDNWHKYCQRQMRDSYHTLDEKLIFSNTETTKKDYASKKLSYPLEPCATPAYETLISTLYSESERKKIEWSIGSIISGDSKKIEKFLVFYGAPGTGKSTVINIITMLFDGYYSVFDAKALGSANNAFALEAFKSNPLIAIQHDGDLSKLEENQRLNSLVSHEMMTVNEKHKALYTTKFNAFLFMGTNKPVKITDAKSGILRRLIDVTPTGNKVPLKEYKTLMKQITFELGGIATHCLDVYLEDKNAYDDYLPLDMLGASNDFYNYIIDSYHVFKKDDSTTLKAAWEMYKRYCEDAKVTYPFSQRIFKEELKSYFKEYNERFSLDDGSRVRSFYSGFRTDKFERSDNKQKKEKYKSKLIEFDCEESIFDTECSECLAQYANEKEIPSRKWDNVKSKLSSLDTKKLHYVKVPENHIVIDFDIKDENGNKSFDRNLEEASKWPRTYAELSKSGGGIHLHYIYNGDVNTLSRIYDDEIEVKIFTGNSSLRRKLSKCNDAPIATISSGLPLKGDKMVNETVVQTEKGLRTTIKKCLNKEVHSGTKCNVDFIYKILEDAYNSDLKYDVSNMYNDVLAFAANSTNQSEYCIKLVAKMHFKSKEESINIPGPGEKDDSDIVFYDVEVFPNLFLVNWKLRGPKNKVVRMINPTPTDIEGLIRHKLVGFNCRRYDNHMLYGRLMGYTNEQLYNLSVKIINSGKGAGRNVMFGEAYNLSYTDVYDFASAGNKKSLKKLEIEMGIHHKELGLPWDQPVPEELWTKVAEYCDNDVIATEAAFDYLSADWTARQILADLAGMTVNDTTNTLTTKIIFGNNRKPQDEFNYRDMSQPVKELDKYTKEFIKESCPDMMSQPFGKDKSLLPYFPGYKYENGVSTYRGEEVGEGGYVYAEPGMYGNVALLDVASMHPHSVIGECLFGPNFTKAFRDIVRGRVNIKHEDWDKLNDMLDGKLTPYVSKIKNGEMSSKDLANGLKTAINSVYGLTSANFENPFRDNRNIDNIVAKRGALFMIDLKYEVQARGYTVAHIKTDSIKIPDADNEIIDFIMEFGKRYGYTFEHEATYDRMCLVNNAVYIAKYKDPDECNKLYGYIPGDNKKHGGEWTATGTQFAVPYVFKKLFSKEKVVFEDMCETFSVAKGDLYLDMNEKLPDVSQLEKELAVITKGNREPERQEELKELIAKGHDLRFVGRVGQFSPILPGNNAGVLYRVNDGKNYAASGTTGFRWLESEMVKELHMEDKIDRSFYDKLANDAIEAIAEVGNYEWFVSDDSYNPAPFAGGKILNKNQL